MLQFQTEGKGLCALENYKLNLDTFLIVTDYSLTLRSNSKTQRGATVQVSRLEPGHQFKKVKQIVVHCTHTVTSEHHPPPPSPKK